MKAVFQSEDGKTFDTAEEALEHENSYLKLQESRLSDKLTKYGKTYNGTALLKRYSLSEPGLWEVRGEDPNCDLGGFHHSPFIGLFQGTLQEVLAKAVLHPSFWAWGGGGSIVKQVVIQC